MIGAGDFCCRDSKHSSLGLLLWLWSLIDKGEPFKVSAMAPNQSLSFLCILWTFCIWMMALGLLRLINLLCLKDELWPFAFGRCLLCLQDVNAYHGFLCLRKELKSSAAKLPNALPWVILFVFGVWWELIRSSSFLFWFYLLISLTIWLCPKFSKNSWHPNSGVLLSLLSQYFLPWSLTLFHSLPIFFGVLGEWISLGRSC